MDTCEGYLVIFVLLTVISWAVMFLYWLVFRNNPGLPKGKDYTELYNTCFRLCKDPEKWEAFRNEFIKDYVK